MKTLYPEIRPFHQEMLDVGDGHQLYLECSGTSTGIPVLIVHGGPGAGCSEQMRRFFDPERYQIILFDQRGAGRSTPHAMIEHNTTELLLADMERIRNHLKVARWVLFGGDFGATLSLLYAQEYPQAVCGLLLRGVFLGRQQDFDWTYRQGAGRFFPEEWQRFLAPVVDMPGPDIIQNYYQILHGENELAVLSAAKAWARWEATNACFRPNQMAQDYYSSTHTAIALARISTHYYLNHFYIDENQIIENIDKIRSIPAYIVQGRYDMICPPEQAWALATSWPEAELDMVREGGHSAFDRSIVDALILAGGRLAERLGLPEDEA